MPASPFKTPSRGQASYLSPAHTINPRSPYTQGGSLVGVIIIAMLLFALSGLILGMTVGIFQHLKGPQKSPQAMAATTHITATSTHTASVNKVPLNCPLIDQGVYQGVANGDVTYTLSAHAVDKSGTCTKSGNAIHQKGITFRLWLTKVPSNKRIDIPASTWSDLNKLQSPLAHEITNGLQFDATTPQVQASNDQGQGTWKFGVSPEVKPGTYYLVVLTDWDGTYANWTWLYFTVKAAHA
ncbi:hypothetical protein KSD_15090 [Ktedonobacter sp. SOSP1-85]|uniref:hypothetical protein n=1 Tax=Ktedonobacter sp. SOSP1-85 TaxID=2778367 RepID=UPI0019163F7E|nr:hypothetical protein [Ktedonobacter sp. SOSP1-85]GHO73738.1 hypothetical protein KSD_15090 [Ktedonobacter sp. SOSP1-85]